MLYIITILIIVISFFLLKGILNKKYKNKKHLNKDKKKQNKNIKNEENEIKKNKDKKEIKNKTKEKNINSHMNKSIRKNSQQHSYFDRLIVSLSSTNYLSSICINKYYGIIVISCNDENIQIHKILQNENNKYITNKIKIGEVYSCININDEGTHLIGVDELTTTLRIHLIEKNQNNEIKKFPLILKGKIEVYKKSPVFLSVYKNTYIITGGQYDETEIKIWNFNGELLKMVNINQIYNYDYAHSITGRFFGVACWSPNIKIFNIELKENNFNKIEKIIELKTNSGTKCICFSNDEEKAFVIDKNSFLISYNLNIRYKLKEESKILNKIDLKNYGFENISKMIISGDSEYIILACKNNLLILKCATFELINKIMEAHLYQINGIISIPETSLFITWADDGLVKLWNLSKE